MLVLNIINVFKFEINVVSGNTNKTDNPLNSHKLLLYLFAGDLHNKLESLCFKTLMSIPAGGALLIFNYSQRLLQLPQSFQAPDNLLIVSK